VSSPHRSGYQRLLRSSDGILAVSILNSLLGGPSEKQAWATTVSTVLSAPSVASAV
jgi:hypothetical protein